MNMNETKSQPTWKTAVFSKTVIVPIALGIGVMLVASGGMFWCGALLTAAGVANSLRRLMTVSANQPTAKEPRHQNEREHLAFLRSLQAKLRGDRDPTSGELLRQLRQVYKRMIDAGWLPMRRNETSHHKPWKEEVREQMVRVYESCVASLDRSFTLWSAAQEIVDEHRKQQLLDARSALFTEIRQSLDRLQKTLDELQVASLTSEQPSEQLSELRRELEQGLEVARDIEKRLREFDAELSRSTDRAPGP